MAVVLVLLGYSASHVCQEILLLLHVYVTFRYHGHQIVHPYLITLGPLGTIEEPSVTCVCPKLRLLS